MNAFQINLEFFAKNIRKITANFQKAYPKKAGISKRSGVNNKFDRVATWLRREWLARNDELAYIEGARHGVPGATHRGIPPAIHAVVFSQR